MINMLIYKVVLIYSDYRLVVVVVDAGRGPMIVDEVLAAADETETQIELYAIQGNPLAIAL
jgi:hypothetical protein